MEQTINIEELVQDDHNLNKGTAEGQMLMERSFKELGAGRSILVDKDGRIIAGNKSQKAAMAAGIRKVRVIETQGDELIAVKRTDLSLDSKEGREMAYADNLTTQVNLAIIYVLKYWHYDDLSVSGIFTSVARMQEHIKHFKELNNDGTYRFFAEVWEPNTSYRQFTISEKDIMNAKGRRIWKV